MRAFHSWLPGLGLIAALSLASAAPAADEIVPGAKLVGRFAQSISVDMMLNTTPDGPRLSGLDGLFAARRDWCVWDGSNGKVISRLPERRATLVAAEGIPELSPDGKRLALIYQWQVTMFSPPTNTVEAVVYDVKTRKMVFLDRRRSPIERTVFTPKGSFLVIDEEVRVLEAGKAKFSRAFKIGKKDIDAVAVSADDSRLALYADGSVFVYDLAEGKLEFEVAIEKVKKNVNGAPARGADSRAGGMTLGVDTLLLHTQHLLGEPGPDQKVQGRLVLVDLKEKKIVKELKLDPGVSCIRAYFTAEGEPQALLAWPEERGEMPKQPAPNPKPAPAPRPVRGPKIPDMLQVFGPPTKRVFKFVDMKGKVLNEFTLNNPPLLVPDAPMALLSPEGRYLATITSTAQAQNKNQCNVAVWDLEKAR